jgi:hypothetical protein
MQRFLNSSLTFISNHRSHLIIVAIVLLFVVIITLYFNRYPPFDNFTNKNIEPFQMHHGGKTNLFTGNRLEAFQMVRGGNNMYKVHEDLQDPHLAAETMDSLNTTAKELIAFLNAKYTNNNAGQLSINPKYRDIVLSGIRDLSKNFKTANMEENIPERSGGDTSFVIDKGDVFAMCLRDPKNRNTIHGPGDLNELRFVLIHEMAHLFTSTFGHDALFWNNFKFLLQEAIELGVYQPINYKKNSKPYCGIVITYSPLYDLDLKEYVTRK